MTPKRLLFGIFAAFLTLGAVYAADLKLNNYFTDGMVLQRDKAVVVKGKSAPGADVTVSFGKQSKSGKADDRGLFAVSLDAMEANKNGQILTVKSGGKTLTIKDVVVGDVWLFARQTSIDVSLGKDAAAKSNFRALTIITKPAAGPRDDVSASNQLKWSAVDKSVAANMSASAFHLGNELASQVDVPIGIVDLNMGPHFAIGWMSDQAIKDALLIHPKDSELPWLPKYMMDLVEARESGKTQKELDEESQKKYGGKELPLGIHPIDSPVTATVGYNAVIHPMKGIALKGILLQLGNDYPFIPYSRLDAIGKSADRLELALAWYQTYNVLKWGFRVTPATLPYVPKDWRRSFGDEALPIAFIAPPGSDLPLIALHGREIRELQRRTMEANPGMGLILSGTTSIPLTAQPADDKLVADRCKDWVLAEVYKKEGVTASGPMVESVSCTMDKAVVTFAKETSEGLTLAKGGQQLFEVAGPDHEFFPAKGTVSGSTVTLTSDDVGMIRFVRYNWNGVLKQGLVNSAGQSAIPFNTSDAWTFAWIPPNPAPDMPEEYSLTADKWKESDVAIINGSVKMPESVHGPFKPSGDSEQIPSWIGPTGIFSAQFGPNILVLGTEAGSPADGKLLQRDVIYSANGKIFGDDQYRDMAAAITHSETQAAAGKLVLGVRRKGKLLEVELTLTVLGSYSTTTPFYCPKSERIVQRAEQYVEKKFRPEEGLPSSPTGFLNSDMMFMLAAGSPQYQGIVRRAVYDVIGKMNIETPPKPGDRTSNWGLGHNAMLLGEYYHATGDKNVLPYLKHLADWAAITQLKPANETPPEIEAAHTEEALGGWRHKYPTAADRWKSGYGLLPHAGMGCVIGFKLAKEAGVKINELAYKRGLTHFEKGRAEHAFVLYSYNNVRRDGPATLDPYKEDNGLSYSMNGKLGMAAALFNLVENKRVTAINARVCTYSFNNTRGGHGGMFFNNFWTPIGAHLAGEKAYKYFINGQTWWRELFRRWDGSFTQAGRGGIGVAYAIHRVSHRKRLRILGAPRSAFGPDALDYLEPALAAHAKRDYALAVQLVQKELKERIVPANERPVVDHFLQSLQILRDSIDYDFGYVEMLIKDGKYYQASVEIPQLMGVVAEAEPRFVAILKALEAPDGIAKIKEGRAASGGRRRGAKPTGPKETWTKFVHGDTAKLNRGGRKPKDPPAHLWRMKIVETVSQAPKGWTTPEFDAGNWVETTQPVSWRMYHTNLSRTIFTVDDKSKLDKLRIRACVFQQLNVVVYINGVMVAKIDDIGRGTGIITAPLTQLALDSLKNGENVIAISTRHNRRWGPRRGKYGEALGVHFELEGRMK